MRQAVGWLRCHICGHAVNPRSERCEDDHPLCTIEGCQLLGQYAGMPVPDPLGWADTDHVAELAAQPAGAAGGPLFLLDIASYQAGINLAACRAAGWSIVNIKTSQGNWYQHGAAVTYARAAQALGMGISGFHWLDNSDGGVNQARYCWQILRQMIDAVGHPVALQVDNEDAARPAPLATVRDFVAEITRLAGHLPYMYTGDWYATSGGRGSWNVAALTPWLMSAPNSGYPGTYPGDGSPQWRAGYWGYGDLAAMQYAVAPIAGAGGGSISKTAIRDPAVWAAMTAGGTPDVDLKDPVPATGQNVGTVLSDIWNLIMNGHSGFVPANTHYLGGRLNTLRDSVQALQTDLDLLQQGGVDVDALATKVTAALIASGANGLTAADHDAVVADVKAALRQGTS